MEERKKEKLLVNLSSIFIISSLINLILMFLVGHYSDGIAALSFGIYIIFLTHPLLTFTPSSVIMLIASFSPLIASILSYVAYKINKLNKTNLIISLVLLSWQIISIIYALIFLKSLIYN
ncbi:hypothetical protein CL618_03655 [archaeon]|nr:hypothetical protein [archaeon]